ncbi:MAG: T9SS type A sorting domain-containing protein [Ignavibacteriales bacterium]|nr:T9SS type A sorting domain-containing protein [Ignavibacteriales bacterium]
MRKFCIALLLACSCIYEAARADWPCRSDTTVPIVTAAGNQWNVHLVSDRKNGAILVWQDRRDGTTDKLFVQRVGPAGRMVWQDGGVQIATSAGYQYYPQIIADDLGGAFIVWQDNRYGVDYDIFIQRINSDGIPWWTPNGTLVCNATGHQYNPRLVTDGSGGVIVTWQDRRNGQFDIYAQRFNAIGSALWSTNGQVVCSDVSDQLEPKLISDGKGGAIIAWTAYRLGSGTTDVYSQRILANGQPAWQPDGVSICNAVNAQWNPQLVDDGSGGAIITWQDRRNGQTDNIYAQRVDANGIVKWAQNGVQLVTASGIQYYPQIAKDGSGGAVVVWQDNRGIDYDIFSQRVNAGGQTLWAAGGVAVCAGPGQQYNPQVVMQGSDVVVTWQDKRTPSYDIYAQRLDQDGSALWSTDGVPISTAPMDQFMPQLASDSLHGAIIAWADYHLNSGSTDIYASRIGANGLLGGGCYRTFLQESLGVKSKRFKKGFSTIIGIPNAGNVRDSTFGRGVFPNGIVVGLERLDSAKYYGWEYFTKSLHVRRALPQWSTPRPFDRIFDRSFVGKLKNPSIIRYNNRLAGELLALKVNIAASDAGIIQEGLGDLVFKDTALQSNPLNYKKLRQITGTIDSILTIWRSYHVNYTSLASSLKKINAAFDGPFDTVSTSPLRITSTKALFSIPYLLPSIDRPTAIPAFEARPVDPGVPDEFTLFQNYPNPFNPFTTIEFVVPEPSVVTVRVVNILGQEVSTPIDHLTMEDGHQVMDFDASNLSSGVYFYQLIAEPLSGNVTMSQVKKMMVLK